MSNQDFENYIALMGKLLPLSKAQLDQMSGELQDHLQMRVLDLVNDGVAHPDAINQAIDEFGDAAVMAKNFQSVLNLKRRRWMMRFTTFSIAGTFLVAVLTMALWPDNSRFGSPDISMAITQDDGKVDQETGLKLSLGTQQTILAEKALRQVVSLDYDETPFSDVETDLEKRTGLNFLLHSSACDDSLTVNEPIKFKLNEMPLNKALKLMLETKNATYVIDEGVVMIISLDDAEAPKWLRLKMYDCRELVKTLPKTGPASHTAWRTGLGGRQGGGGGGGMFAIRSAIQDNERSREDPQQSSPAFDQSKLLDQKLAKIMSIMKAEAEKNRPDPSSENTLLNLVSTMVQPDSWTDSGHGIGQIQVVNGILVVSQTEEVLQGIEDFLADLEGNILKDGKRGVSLDSVRSWKDIASVSESRASESTDNSF